MKLRLRITISFALVAATLILGGCSTAGSVPNLADVRRQLVEYADSGSYEHDLDRVVERASRFLTRRLDRVDRPAIVLDIDDTSLSTWEYELETNFCFSRETWTEWVRLESAPAVESTLELYRMAIRNDVAVFFITGRRESLRAATESNLKSVGFETWSDLYMKPDEYAGSSAAAYKTASRKEIEGEGYSIVVNMGDQKSDLSGGYAERAFLLPNPFYEVP